MRATSLRLRPAAALLFATACFAVASPAANAIWLTGTIDGRGSDGGTAQITFTCQGENPCRGTYSAMMQYDGCETGAVDSIVITGLDLSRTGSVSGSATLTAIEDRADYRGPDGLCRSSAGPFPDISATFTGIWDGSTIQLSIATPPDVTMSGSARVMNRLAKVSGSMHGAGKGSMSAIFSCEGETPCIGTSTATFRDDGCSNDFTFTEKFAMSGLQLSQPGSISGVVIFRGGDFSTVKNPGGTCTYALRPGRDGGAWYSGSWNGSSGSFTLLDTQDYPISGGFTASLEPLSTTVIAPVFPMTVTSSITPTVSTVRADIQYRPADVGTSGSVFSFALAPQSLVKSAPGSAEPLVLGKSTSAGGDKDTPVACVLAQLNSSGQLQGVSSTSGLQAYVSSVFSSQGQAVKVIDGVATPNVAGSTFYVGYGSDANAMISGGINRSVVTVPGTQVCQPQPAQTGWWWNPAEGGRGYTIESSGHKLFIAAYLYDVSGRSTWYISAGNTSLDGSLYVGNLESYSGGQTLTGTFKPPRRPPAIAGQLTLAFSDATHGTLVWPGGTVPITRYEFGTGGVNAVPQANQPENGWWWNAEEDGRGFFIEWQANRSFTAAFMYEADDHPVWYIAAAPPTNDARVLTSSWEQYANGQTLTGPYKPATQTNPNVGALRIDFSGPSTGLMTLPDGRTVALSRYRF